MPTERVCKDNGLGPLGSWGWALDPFEIDRRPSGWKRHLFGLSTPQGPWRTPLAPYLQWPAPWVRPALFPEVEIGSWEPLPSDMLDGERTK